MSNELDKKCYYDILSESFIREHTDVISWNLISEYQKLSEKFIEEFKDKVNWYLISEYQELSEDFIIKFIDFVHINTITKHQKLSVNFINKYNNLLDMDLVAKYQKLSIKDRLKCKLKIISPHYLDNNWLYKSVDKKKKYITEYTNYVCNNNSIEAYMLVYADGRCIEKPNMRFEKGKYSTNKCDCNADVLISFGFKAGPKLNVYSKEYKLLKVLIDIRDIGVILADNKIRCYSFSLV